MFGLVSKKKVDVQLNEKDEEIQKLRQELSDLESMGKKYSEESNKNLEENKRLKDELKLLEEKHQSIFNDPELIKNVIKDSKVDELVKENDRLSKDLAKTKKELESVEDDLEETEDDLKSEKKKFQEKKEEFTNLQEKYLTLEIENKKNNEKLEISEKKVSEQDETIKLKNSSLDFIKEILNAKEITETSGDDTISKIDSVVDYVLGDFRDCVNEFFEKYPERDDYFFNFGLWYWSAISKKSWLKNKTTIAFVGEFSAGKTSIVNKILSQGGGKKGISLPVSTKATTAIPTYISNSSTNVTSFKFYTPDNKLKLLSEKTFKQVDKGILAEVEGVSNLIKYFVMTCDNNNLKDLSILDTPGFTSNDKEDAIRTIDVINECDALFWFFDVNAGTVNRASLKIIKENLQKPLFVIINKVDTKAPGEVDKVEKLIKETFEKENIKVEDYIRFSYNDDPVGIIETLNNVPKSNDTISFANNLKDLATNLSKILNDCVDDYAKKKAYFDVEKDNSFENIISSLGKVKNICVDINDIIRSSYSEHFFKANNFEISEEDYDRIVKKLNKLIEYEDTNSKPVVMDALVESIDKYSEAVRYSNEALNNYMDVKSQKDRFDECVKQLKKRLSAIK